MAGAERRDMIERLRTRIDDRTAAVGVVGLGYVGLPLGVEFARVGSPCKGAELASVPLTAPALAGADCVVIHSDHSTFEYDWIVEHARLVFDTRNATREVKAGRDKIVRL